jgi:anaerobic magnesium-protoporphyrin IX monomethyl ester cyclase
MKVSFIEPRGAFEGFSFGWLKHLPMTGPLYLATILKQRGHDVEVIRESINEVDCSRLDCDVLCLSIMTSTARRGYEIARQFKKLNPGKKVIVGGVHATFRPKEALKYADIVLVGEGDTIITDLVENGHKGIVQGNPCNDLDALPYPDLSLLKNTKLPLPRTPISTSRGCPFNCNFCSVTEMFGRGYRFRSPENIVNEITSRKNKRLFFYDDNFGAVKTRTKEILRRMKENKVYTSWATQSRIDVSNDDELMNLMVETNCNYLCLGLESINPETLKEYNKHQELDGIKKAIRRIHDYGIKIHGMFVFGADKDNKKVIKDTVEFCNHMEIESPQFSILTPLPGSQLYNQLDEQGRIFSKNWDLYDLNHVVFQPKSMSAYELQQSVVNATRDLYWITRRGWKFFFENFGSSLRDISNCLKWYKDHNKYLKYLKNKMHIIKS